MTNLKSNKSYPEYKLGDLVYVVDRDIIVMCDSSNTHITAKKGSICVVVKKESDYRLPYYGEAIKICISNEEGVACGWVNSTYIRPCNDKVASV